MKLTKYSEFWSYYLGEHRNPTNRLLHVLGCLSGVGLLPILWMHFGFAGLVIALGVGYSFAWVGHWVFEGNRPATWRYPLWSFVSEFRMVGLIVTGRLKDPQD